MGRAWILGAAWLAACGAADSPRPEPEPVEVCTEGTPTEAAAPADEEPSAGAEQPTVVLDGTPEIPDALRDRLSQYLETRSADVAGVAPDGSSVTVLTRFSETAQIHHVAEPMGMRRQLTFTEEPVRAAEPVPGDEGSLLFLADVGGAEDYQIFELERDEGRITRLTDGESRHNGWVFSHDGSRIAFNNNARNGTDVDVYVSRGLGLREATRVTSEEGHWYPIDFSRDGSKLLVGHYVSINDSRIHLVDVDRGEMTRLTPEEPVASYRSARFSRDGDRVYVTTDREGEFVELYEMDPAGPSAEWRPLTRDIGWNVEDIELSGDGRTLAVVTNEDGWSVLRLLDTRSRRLREVDAIGRGLIGDLRWASDAPVIAMTLSGPTRTGDAYTYDVRRRRLTRWTES